MGATLTVDVNNMTDVNEAVFRLLGDNLDDRVTQAFIGQFNNGNVRTDGRPRLTASQIADAIMRGKERAAAMSASVNGGCGNFTEDRHNKPERSFEEITERITVADITERARWGIPT